MRSSVSCWAHVCERRWLFLAFVLFAACISHSSAIPARAEAVTVVVTSAADSDLVTAECPSETECTLRKAIELINGSSDDRIATILFAESAFPRADPAAIAVTGSALPPITRENATIDGSASGVVIDGSNLGDAEDGLVLEGASATVRGIEVVGFPGACIVLKGLNATAAGDPSAGTGNRVGDCDTGIRVSGAGSALRGSVVGFASDGTSPQPVRVGIEVTAASVTVGGTGIEPALANVIGNAGSAVVVGGSGGDPFSGVVIARNRIGEDSGGAAAAVERGVLISAPAMSTRVVENTIGAATISGIAVSDGSTGNTISMNTFRPLSGLAVDLGDDRVADSNDIDDADEGANNRLNHPEVTRPTQAAIQGTACPGCRVDLYRVAHTPGGAGDSPSAPLVSAIGDAAGAFMFGSPAVSPGDWISATATDTQGNTSEFSPPTRVGAGAILCGNLALDRGWNQAGYFGTGSAVLGSTFPGDPFGRIRAVYHLEADGAYTHWFRDTAIGRTLTAVEPGLSYWFLVDEPLTLATGFSLTAPLGVQLRPGWNEFVYFGASANGLDAFASLAAAGATVYRFDSNSDGGEWLRWGTSDSPAYARQFEDADACGSYTAFMDESAVLRPLHP
ncbi:MAG: hypothetical protein AB7P25_04270 [Dehalococcoidia bacterium]